MNNTDERLSDLLAERARQGSGARPSMDGVQTAIHRRSARRRRQRTLVSGAAVAVVLAGAAGALALSGGLDDPDPAPIAEGLAPSDLPLVGVDLVGFARDPSLDPEITPSGPEITYAAFTGDEPDVLGPMMTASLQTGDLDPVGTPVDLDVDGSTDGAADGWLVTFPDGAGVSWAAEDRIASINGHGLPADVVVDYAQQLSGQPFDLEAMPAPVGLENREVVTFEPVPDFPSRVAGYRGPSTVVYVLTTSDAGYFDLTRIVSTEGTPYQEISLGPTFLGAGQAILSDDDDGATSALVRTEAGLTVHVFGQGLDAETLRAAIEEGRLVELDAPTPTPTTAVAPVTTVPTDPQTTTSIPSTTAPGASVMPIDVTLEPGDEFDRVEVFFAEAIPGHELTVATEPFGGDCGPAPTDGEAYLTLRLDVPSLEGVERWPGIDLVAPGSDGKVRSIWSCGWFEGAVYISIALDAPREPEVYEGFGQPVLIIDIPAS